MKKILPAIFFLFAVLANDAFGQTTEDVMLNLRQYSSLFINDRGRLDSKYYRAVSDADFEKIVPLGGDTEDIDTPLEIALLSNSVGVVNVRPIEASQMLGTAKQADLKLGAAVFQEIQILRFLGNTAAAGRHEGMLKFITDRGNATRAEVETYYRNGIRGLISATVDEEFNKINFMVDINPQTSYTCVLTRSANNQYILSYESYFGISTKSKKELSAQTLESLASAMSRSGEFSQAAIDQVRAQAALIPAVYYEDNNLRTLSLIKDVLREFYTTPNQTNYNVVRDAYASFRALEVSSLTSRAGRYSFEHTLRCLNPALAEKVLRDVR